MNTRIGECYSSSLSSATLSDDSSIYAIYATHDML